MTLVLASISLNWRSGLLFLAAAIFAVVFIIGGTGTPRAWNVEALAFCLGFIAWGLWATGVN
jgi:hypothetical protein